MVRKFQFPCLRRLKGVLVLLILSCCFNTVYSQYYHETFESGLRKPPWNTEGHHETVSQDFSLSGKRSFRAYLPLKRYSKSSGGNSARSEIRWTGGNTGTPNHHPHFTTWGIKLAIYFPEDFQPDKTSAESVFQFHGVRDKGDTYRSPPMMVRVVGNSFNLTNRWISKKIASDADQHEKTWNISQKVVPGKWHYFVVDVHWDYRENGNGFLKVYMNVGSPADKGDLVVNYSGPTGYNDDLGSYFKMGIYKWDWTESENVEKSKKAGVKERLLYYDDYEIKAGGFFSGKAGSSNADPKADAGDDQTVILPTNKINLKGSGSDEDGKIKSYQWTQVTGPKDASLRNDDTPTLTASKLVEGAYLFRLTVTDDDGAKDSDDVLVVVESELNQEPTADAGPDQTVTLPENTISIQGDGDDPDGTIKKYEWTKKSGPSANLKNDDTKELTVNNLREGEYVFTLKVTDNNGATDSDNVKVIVEPASNQDPTADAGPNRTLTLPTNSITLSGTATDPDGDIASYKWTKVSGPSGVTMNAENTANLKLSDLVEGKYVFRLTVTDDKGAKDNDDVQVTVKSKLNESPEANAGPNRSITLPKNSLTVNGSGSDTDGKIVSFSWKQGSGPSKATLSGDNTAKLVASNLIEGTYVFQLTVTDDGGLSDVDEMRIVVHAEALNESPEADAGPNKIVTLPTNKVSFNGKGTDSDGTIDSFAWTQISGPSNADLSDENTSNLTAENLVEGKYVFQLSVTDNSGDSSTDDVVVTVKSPSNIEPEANAGPNKTIRLPKNSFVLDGSNSKDADGSIAAYQWKQLSGPKVTLSGASTSSLTVSDLVEGKYKFELTVDDNKGAQDTDEVAVTILAPTLSIAGDVTDATCTTNNGAIAISIQGGSGPFTYSWSNGAATKNLQDLTTGDYKITVTDSNGKSVTKTFTVASKKAAIKVNATVKNTTCTANNGSIKVEASGGTAPYSYEWSSNARAASLNKLAAGSYSLVVKDQNGCSQKFSFEVGVDAGETTHDITSNIQNASCAGDDGEITLKANGENGPYSFVWEHGTSGASLNRLKVGKYKVTITDVHGCYMEAEYTINQNPGPAKPIISQSGDSLYVTQTARTYQWFKDSVAIVGANQRSLKYSEAGTYSVQISNNQQCTTSSDYFFASDPPTALLDAGSYTMSQIDVYPNPAFGQINVRLALNESAATSFTIYDFQGRVMESKEFGVINNQIIESLNIDQYPSGTYLLRVKANQEIVTRRFIKH